MNNDAKTFGAMDTTMLIKQTVDSAIDKALHQSVYYEQLLQSLRVQFEQRGVYLGIGYSQVDDFVVRDTDGNTKQFHSINETITYAFELLMTQMQREAVDLLSRKGAKSDESDD